MLHFPFGASGRLVLNMRANFTSQMNAASLTLHVLFSSRECTRGGFCNFMHLKPISRELRRELYGRRKKGLIYISIEVLFKMYDFGY